MRIQTKVCHSLHFIGNENDRSIGEEFPPMLQKKFQSGGVEGVNQINRLSAVLALQQPEHFLLIFISGNSKSIQSLIEDLEALRQDRKSTRLNSSHSQISYAVFCLKKKKKRNTSSTI